MINIFLFSEEVITLTDQYKVERQKRNVYTYLYQIYHYINSNNNVKLLLHKRHLVVSLDLNDEERESLAKIEPAWKMYFHVTFLATVCCA